MGPVRIGPVRISWFASAGRCDTLHGVDASVETLIDLALAEDIGAGDVTSLYFVPEGRQARAFVVAREEGVLSGVDVAERVLQKTDDSLAVSVLLQDGSRVSRGALVMEIRGNARSILTAERTVLNFLQHLGGVASLTRKYVEAVTDTHARILDTRKTTPGWRWLEKRAVVHGGGTNHRMGLYDRAMVKDNHLMAEGHAEVLQASIRRLKSERPGVEVELEADNLRQVAVFLCMEGVDHILLDNMTPEDMREAVALRGRRNKPQLEASGGVNLKTVRDIAKTGVDFISVGALTHSAKSMDLAMDFAEDES
jgi:nicotinate-nucleotide pyrophosphorylase (carboxylating)